MSFRKYNESRKFAEDDDGSYGKCGVCNGPTES